MLFLRTVACHHLTGSIPNDGRANSKCILRYVDSSSSAKPRVKFKVYPRTLLRFTQIWNASKTFWSSNTHGSTSGCSCDVFGKWPPRSINWAVTWWSQSGVQSRCCKTHAATTSCCSSFLRRVASKWSSRNFKHPICISNVARSNWPGLWEAYKFTFHELQARQANSISSHSAC